MNGEIVQFKSTSHYRYEYYACSGQNRHTGCKARKVPRAVLENTIIETISEIIFEPQMVAARYAQMEQEHGSAASRLATQRADLANRLQALRRRIHNITETIAEEGRAARTLLSKLNEYEREETFLLSELTQLRQVEPAPLPSLAKQQERAAHLRQVLAGADPRVIRTILAALIDRITVELDEDAKFIKGMLEYYDPPDKTEEGPSEEDPSTGFMPTVKCPRRSNSSRHKNQDPFSSYYSPDNRPKRPEPQFS